MINPKEFSSKLLKIIEFYNLSASAFADKIGVQRSSISHILSGRNKPSLDFVLKVTKEFPDVELYWLLKGKGIFPTPKQKVVANPATNESLNQNSPEEIERIVIFYKDGTFKSFIN